MKNIFSIFFLGLSLTVLASNRDHFKSLDDYPVPDGEICEMSYSNVSTEFSLWAPTANKVKLSIYTDGYKGMAYKTVLMKRESDGCWKITVAGDLVGKFYDFNVRVGRKWRGNTPGIFAKAVGLNGKRAAILDMASTNPLGWDHDKRPALSKPSDLIVYEMHLRDFSISSTSGINRRGKFLSMTEYGTHNGDGLCTGIDHLKDLGVNAVQILPMFDFGSVDESNLKADRYNWGYDPVNYNVPDGSYSSNPIDPGSRIREMKQMVQSFHKSGIRVIMDVVYNHTFSIEGSNFDHTVPGYFYRYLKDGKPSDASGCGNETASERAMMRKFMVESVCYWVNEYHIDGFRFDLMGIHDIETMKAIRVALDKIDPSITIYGEGWTAGTPAISPNQLAIKANIYKMDGIGAFGDELRDALRGPFNDDHKGAFLAGLSGEEESIKFGIVGGIRHPEVDCSKVNYSKEPWTKEPFQMVAYVSCHDDMCLADRLRAEMPDASEQEILSLDKLAQTVVMTSQGLPFIFSGEEIFRSKKGVHNSFNSPDSINEINWQNKSKYNDLYQYYCGLIQLRKSHPAFRMGDAAMIRKHLHFLNFLDSCVVGFKLSDYANGDMAKNIIVIFNANRKAVTINIDNSQWRVLACEGKINVNGIKTINGDTIEIAPMSAFIIQQ
jgi:pullulanase